MTQLSICIPTYNFGCFIGDTLKSIIEQATAEVEIIVVDGASTDNTQEVVRSYQRSFPRLKYFYLEVNGGVDRDLAKAVGMAEGEYCWLMSSDDLLRPGAVKRILDEIQLGCDIYLCNRTEFVGDLKFVRDKFWLSHYIGDQIYYFKGDEELNRYFSECRSLGALFSYISSIVVKKDSWNKYPGVNKFIGTAYAHVGVMFHIIKNKNSKLKYIKYPLIWCRIDDDRFCSNPLQRILLDFNGYQSLSDHFFSENPRLLQAILKVMTREHPWYRVIKMRHLVKNDCEWSDIKNSLIGFGFNKILIYVASILGKSNAVVIFLLFILGYLRKWGWGGRGIK